MLDQLKNLDADDIQELVQLVQSLESFTPLLDATLATAAPILQRFREPVEQFHAWQTELDVRRFKTYMSGGMSPDQALALMVHRKQEIARAVASSTATVRKSK